MTPYKVVTALPVHNDRYIIKQRMRKQELQRIPWL